MCTVHHETTAVDCTAWCNAARSTCTQHASYNQRLTRGPQEHWHRHIIHAVVFLDDLSRSLSTRLRMKNHHPISRSFSTILEKYGPRFLQSYHTLHLLVIHRIYETSGFRGCHHGVISFLDPSHDVRPTLRRTFASRFAGSGNAGGGRVATSTGGAWPSSKGKGSEISAIPCRAR